MSGKFINYNSNRVKNFKIKLDDFRRKWLEKEFKRAFLGTIGSITKQFGFTVLMGH